MRDAIFFLVFIQSFPLKREREKDDKDCVRVLNQSYHQRERESEGVHKNCLLVFIQSNQKRARESKNIEKNFVLVFS